MPFPNMHSARIKSPDGFEPNGFRTNTLPNGIIQIMGKLKGQTTMTVQALRFPREKFTAQQAKAWMTEHKLTAILFEPASASENKNIEWLDSYADISGVEVFREGTHNGDKYTPQDMDDFVRNFKTLQGKLIPKVKITHAEDQKKVAGLASYGDVRNVFTKVVGGTKKLFVDLVRVPEQVAQWIRDGRFAERSIEVFRNITIDGKRFKNVLTKVALLGHEIPAVGGMGAIKLSIESDMSSELIEGDFDLANYSYEMSGDDNICIFKISENMGGGDMDVLAELKKQFADMNEKLAEMLKASDGEKGGEEIAKFQEQMKVFETKIADAEKEAGEDNKKLVTEMEKKDEKLKAYEKTDADNKEKLRKQGIDTFVTELKTKGKVIPAFEKEVTALLYSLDDSDKKDEYTMKIKAGDEEVDQKLSQLEYAQKLFAKMAKIVTYGEIASAGGDMDEKKEGGEKKVVIAGATYELDNADQEEKIKKYMAEHEGCTEEDATIAVMDAARSNKAPQ